MDPILYKAAVEGNTGNGDDFLLVHLRRDEEFGCQVTPKGNTILHVAALHGHSNFVQKVLTNSLPLLCRQNKKNETALHIAANEGHVEVVCVLLNQGEGKELLMEMTDNDGDTALHKAVRNQQLDVVKLLVKEKDPEFILQANLAGETPLYLAAESGFQCGLHEILKSCSGPSYSGPCGRTALHAAIIHGFTDCTRSLLQWNKSVCEEADMWGWNPLHYAVRLNLIELVSEILHRNRSLAYLPAGSNNDWTTVFHIAATEGNKSMMEELLRYNPDCWEMLNSKGQNALHVAILNEQNFIVKFILEFPNYHNLINEKDNDGNTPLHLLSASSCYVPELIDHPRAMKMAFNKENQTPQDATLAYSWSQDRDRIECHLLRVGRIGRRDFKIGLQDKEKPKDKVETMDQTQQEQKIKKGRKRMIDKVVKATQTHLIVATLVVTVTFAAGFTLPGGFDSSPGPNQGMAILTRQAAFKAFIITDAISFVSSAGAVFSYFAMAANAAFFQELRVVQRLYMIATGLQLLALAALVLAFVTGIYATLAHSIGLVITVSAIGCFSFLIYFYMLSMTFNWKSL